MHFTVGLLLVASASWAKPSSYADDWIENTLGDKYAECGVYYFALANWPGLPVEITTQSTELAKIASKALYSLAGVKGGLKSNGTKTYAKH